jgi:hypothetical protein
MSRISAKECVDDIGTYQSRARDPSVRYGHTNRKSRSSCIVAHAEGRYLNKHHQLLLDALGQQSRVTGGGDGDVVDRSAAHEFMLEVQHATCCSYVCNAS